MEQKKLPVLGMTKSGLPVKQTSPQHYIKHGYKPNFEKDLVIRSSP